MLGRGGEAEGAWIDGDSGESAGEGEAGGTRGAGGTLGGNVGGDAVCGGSEGVDGGGDGRRGGDVGDAGGCRFCGVCGDATGSEGAGGQAVDGGFEVGGGDKGGGGGGGRDGDGGDASGGLSGGCAGGWHGVEVHENSVLKLQPVPQQPAISSAVQSRHPCAAHSFAASTSDNTPAADGLRSGGVAAQTDAAHEPP